jgi:predicted enzyme involved in methoxymalonyl-ACP biosynthesis
VDDELNIQLWLMSCRVLKRGVEQLVCNYVVDKARGLGVSRLHGAYLPTAKNGLVRDLYPALGFVAMSNRHDDGTHWSLDPARYSPFEVSIQLAEDY